MHDQKRAVAVVRPHGDLDLDTAPDLQRELAAALGTHREVVVDLSAVDFMDCAGLRPLARAGKEAEREGACLVLRGAGPRVLRLLRLTGTDRYLTLEP
ncbi:STAS domain-containing protein [Streptomyces sp. TLI_171]|uniref:STAS domain-containing protein n=1 Tax=Streptomyces sp. TLI_171 TaxID=1938859 RepID=UPI000C18CFC1|nr:STAS domain-containing protein [Streptomyces sp. TLI_171]RKE23562.1 anti-sigma B factor antagonist [Streptomyces sp. TLI_171]